MIWSIMYICDQIWQKPASMHTMTRLTFRFLHQWTNNPCVYHCQWFPGLLFLGLVSWACMTCSSARVVFKWQWWDWTWQLEIATTWLVRVLGHQIGYYLWSIELKQASNETIWQCSISMCGKTCHCVAFHHSWPPSLGNHLWYWCKNYLKWRYR